MKQSTFGLFMALVVFVVGMRIAYKFLSDYKPPPTPQKIVIPDWDKSEDLPLEAAKPKTKSTKSTTSSTSGSIFKSTKKSPKVSCNDTQWCMPMPKTSLLRFDPPSDADKWKLACVQASKGEQVLLKRTMKVFPNHQDFLDGDISFRKWNNMADFFVDKRSDLSFLKEPLRPKRRLEEFDWEKRGMPVLPAHYRTEEWSRAPVLKMGYFAFDKKPKNNYFEGDVVGEAVLGLGEFLAKWKAVKDQIRTPFIALHGANENWGWLSTHFPNRTIDWGSCCYDKEREDLLDFLNHNKTLMLMIEQHSNFTHPKLVTFPRGLPLTNAHVNRLVWDTMHLHHKRALPKSQLLFTASSKWGARPQIIACVSKKFPASDFSGVGYEDSQVGRIDPKEYYRRLATSRAGLALSGLGADTFRLWELMTIGSMAVIEKGMGLDKLVWRLPALVVEDFDQLTPELLRRAYVEALYHADDFEYEKLTQSFWWSFIGNVSRTMTSRTVMDRFPARADETNFVRPLHPFTCWDTNSCGKGTKRVPKTSC